MAKRWEILLWSGAERVDDHNDHEYEGELAGALERAEDVVQSYRDVGWTRPLEAVVRPAGVLHETVPRGWCVDEELGELRRVGEHRDPLPHVAVRAMRNGGVMAICERGLQRSKPALLVIARVVTKHLRSAKSVSAEQVAACELELEQELGRVAARGEVVAVPLDEPVGRAWK